MRITNANMTNTYRYNLNATTQRMHNIHNQLSNQTVINKVSDDPYRAIRVMDLKNEITNVENLNGNADELLGWTEQTDTALDTIGNLTRDIKTLVTSISGIHTDAEVKAISKEVEEKVKQIAELFNSTHAGQNIFSGTATDKKAVNIVNNPDGTISIEKSTGSNNDPIKGEISPGITISYNSTIDEVTKNGELFTTLNDLMKTLNTSPVDFDKLHESKASLESGINGILDARSTLGAKMNSIESMKENNISNIEKMTETLSKINDVDVVQAAVELKTAELAYTASLQVGAKLMQTSILDYIR